MTFNSLLLLPILVTIGLSYGQTDPTPDPNIMQQNCTKFSKTNEYWVSFRNGDNNCYFFSSQYTTLSWFDARLACRQKNANLVSIHNYKTNYLLSNRTHTSYESYTFIFWIGLNSLEQRGQYKWSDNTENQYMHFANVTSSNDALPPNIMDQGRCVSMKSMPYNTSYSKKNLGFWFKDDCNYEHRYICAKSMLPPTNPPVTASPPPPGNCPSDWFQFANQKCIKYIKGDMNYTKARDMCITTNRAEMLSIHSEEEQNFITAYTAGRLSPYIGFRKINNYDGWNWDDSQPNDFTNWGIFNTDYYSKQWCTSLVTNSTQPGKWIQTMCNETHSVICEKKLNTSIANPGITYIESICKIPGYKNFIQYRNSCYYFFDSDSNKFLNFTDAEKSCGSLKSHLVSIVDPFEEAFLRYIIKQYGNNSVNMYWIGLQSKIKLIARTNVSQAFEWSDEWPVYFTNWDKYEPRFAGLPQEECVTFDKSNGTWRTTMCDSTNAYICKVTANKMPKLNSDKSGVCPPIILSYNKTTNIDKTLLWVDIDKRSQYCFWFSNDLKLGAGIQSWVDASFNCRKRKGTLVAIHSNHELMLLKPKLYQNPKNYYYNTWIGLSNNINGKYVWEDNSEVEFTNWNPNEKIVTHPINISEETSRMCVEMVSQTGMWKQQPCIGTKRNYYVCQIKKIYTSGSTITRAGLILNFITGLLIFIIIC